MAGWQRSQGHNHGLWTLPGHIFPQIPYIRWILILPKFYITQRALKFKVFQSYHCFPHWPWQPYLSTFFSRDADADTELLCLAYALVQFSARAFCSISLCFSHYNFVHAELLAELLAASELIQCDNLSIRACLADEHHIDQPDNRGEFRLYPLPTTSIWYITASWRTYALLPWDHYCQLHMEDAIEHDQLP